MLHHNELENVFGISESLGCKTFNKVVRVLVAAMYDVYVSLPVTEQQWMEELTGFIENYVYLNSILKNNFSFKKRYSRTNLGLVSYNKLFSVLVEFPHQVVFTTLGY